MTLTQLKQKIEIANLQGMAALSNYKLEVYQQMAFDWMLNLCEPLNLLVAYKDSNIYRAVGDEWFLKKPIIAKNDDEYIDIDERLEMAFVYIIISFLAVSNGGEKRFEASRLVLEYAININEMGYSKAKRVYEQESFLTAVKFDCYGKFYEVSEDFVKLIIDCILCNGVCMDASENLQLEKYKSYLVGVVLPLDKERLVAVDNAVFKYLMKDIELVVKHSEDELNAVTTRFEELCKVGEGQTVDSDVIALDKRMATDACCEPRYELRKCKDEY